MLHYIWPILLVVSSGVIYQLCAKKIPLDANPFASLTITYLVGAATSIILYLFLNRQGNLLEEFAKLNWTAFVFGIVIIGLEAGWIYVYKAGWQVSVAPVVQSALLAMIMLFVGFLFYHEPITWNKVAGVIACLFGLILINLK